MTLALPVMTLALPLPHPPASLLPRPAVIGDGDTGYGNAVNVRRTVAGYAAAGFAGILIEDQQVWCGVVWSGVAWCSALRCAVPLSIAGVWCAPCCCCCCFSGIRRGRLQSAACAPPPAHLATPAARPPNPAPCSGPSHAATCATSGWWHGTRRWHASGQPATPGGRRRHLPKLCPGAAWERGCMAPQLCHPLPPRTLPPEQGRGPRHPGRRPHRLAAGGGAGRGTVAGGGVCRRGRRRRVHRCSGGGGGDGGVVPGAGGVQGAGRDGLEGGWKVVGVVVVVVKEGLYICAWCLHGDGGWWQL